MIRVYGTSHVSQDSIELIDDVMEQDPDIVALELDDNRLRALKNGEKNRAKSIFLRLLQRLQNRIGEKTGLMPGKEMLHAYERSLENMNDVALIDQDIRVTLDRLKSVNRKEKAKAFFSLLLAFILPFGSLDASKIPDEEEIQEMIEMLQGSYPEISRVLLEERNNLMAMRIAELQDRNPEAFIAVFVGAAHKKSIESILEAEGYAVGGQSSLAQFQ